MEKTNELIDVSEKQDRGVLKKIIKEGTGDCALEGDKVSVHYTGRLLDGTKFDSSKDRGVPFEFNLGKGEVIKGWDMGVKSMKVGEVAEITCKPEYAYGKAGQPPSIPPDATLVFEVELLNVLPEDISPNKDGSILKSIIKKGEGYSTPNEGALVKAHIKGRCADHVFQDEDIEIVLDDDALVEGLVIAFKKMKKGEESKIILFPKYAYGYIGCPELNIPPNSKVVFDVELKDFEKAKESWEMDLDEKLEQSAILKDKGAQYFKEGKYKKALASYKKINDYLQYEPNAKDEKLQTLNNLKHAANSNLALCYLKIKDYNKCIEFCNKAIEVDPNSEKAFFRKGMANLDLKNFDEAIKCFELALKIDPNNKATIHRLQVALHDKKLQNQKDKELYGKIFEKMSKLPPIEQQPDVFTKAKETFEDLNSEEEMEDAINGDDSIDGSGDKTQNDIHSPNTNKTDAPLTN